jgi:hypothetical protein
MNRATSVALARTQSPPRLDRPLAVVEPGMPVRRTFVPGAGCAGFHLACAPSGDAQPHGPFIACWVTATRIDRRTA